MAPRKLSESDKKDILNRYRQTDESTTTLANIYGVSTSTISRLLKQTLPEDEYEQLVQQKRASAFRNSAETEESSTATELKPPVFVAEVEEEDLEPDIPGFEAPRLRPSAPQRRQRKRGATAELEPSRGRSRREEVAQLELPTSFEPSIHDLGAIAEPSLLTAPLLQTDLGIDEGEEDLEPEDLDEDLDGEEDDLDGDLDGEDDDFDDEDFAEGDDFRPIQIQAKGQVKVYPISEALIPRICYVVVDRSSELITRPLKDFAELGQIPDGEIQEKTLPIFDNHRIAKRFMRRMQRVVKVPDGRVFQKVTPYLQAKGITRLLIDGQVYSL
ncbi:MAG: hypothetical protein MUF49_05975 [Oculatellaceae cyanobacterium Prado106]|jgi:hypothetical protein|nr:hypothetical protein [Oculatellaceae cyanobacterium Prado106]